MLTLQRGILLLLSIISTGFRKAFIMLDLLQYQMIITLVLDVRPWFRNFKYSLIPNFDPDWSLSWPTPSLCLRGMLPRNALPVL